MKPWQGEEEGRIATIGTASHVEELSSTIYGGSDREFGGGSCPQHRTPGFQWAGLFSTLLAFLPMVPVEPKPHVCQNLSLFLLVPSCYFLSGSYPFSPHLPTWF